ncbi:MAG TPA: hypothetical protein ENJ82_12005 [Bacteroidetes bacterium]|nr:hypothetical protein [Bacteroidota bacterium]
MSDQKFRLTSKHTRNFGGMALLGVILLILGYVMSIVDLPGNHAADHHAATVEHSDDHAVEPTGHEHGEATGHGSHAEADQSGHMEDGTWLRAVVHPKQIHGVHHHTEVSGMTKFGASFLGASFWWLAVSLFGVFFIAVGYLANVGWYVMLKRVLENYYRFLPFVGGILLLVFIIFGKDIYMWKAVEEGTDALIDGKRALLNGVFFIASVVLLVSVWSLLAHMIKKASHAEEAQGGLENHKKSIKFSAIFMPTFGLGFSAASFLWLMSVDPHWFSTIYAVYCFAGLFVGGMTVTMFITTHLRDKGHLPNLHGDHLHDMGKFMFAFSIFWAYIWVSQYLLIWYANIPEETVYYFQRMENYQLLFALNVVLNFVYPFIAMMPRKAKREAASLRSVGRVILLGRLVDVYLLIAPGVLGAEGGFATLVMMAGAFLVLGGGFLFVVFKGFEDAPLEAKNHPYFGESIHHETGV